MGVVKLADYRPQLEVVEHRVAELEDGYTRTANTLLEAAMLYRILKNYAKTLTGAGV